MNDKFILDGHKAVRVDLMTWAKWYEKADRKVAKDTVGESRISTVFLGMNHQWGKGPPLLFETMVFDGPLDGEQERCSTWEQAEAQHAEIVEKVKAAA